MTCVIILDKFPKIPYFEKRNLWKSYDKDLGNFAYNQLITNGFQVEYPSKDTVNIEYHFYECLDDSSITCPIFDEHIDDYGGVSWKVHTCIIYLENTFLEGGDLIIYGSRDDKSIDKNVMRMIDTKEPKVILFRGDTWHNVTEMKGVGKRRCIVIQCKAR